MDFYPAIWNVLHDGNITAVRGAVPGTVQLDVSIDYLRERFPDPGKTIQVILAGCTRFAYRDFDEREFTTDFSAIAAFEPEVLSAELRDGLCVLDCAGGVLELSAADGSVALDSGRAITLQELIDVADAYWTEWSERAKKARQT
jgi:hypothetical protein